MPVPSAAGSFFGNLRRFLDAAQQTGGSQPEPREECVWPLPRGAHGGKQRRERT